MTNAHLWTLSQFERKAKKAGFIPVFSDYRAAIQDRKGNNLASTLIYERGFPTILRYVNAHAFREFLS